MNKAEGSPKSNFPPLLHFTYILQQSSDEKLLKETGIGLSQARILSALSASPHSQHAVAAALGQTQSNVSRQLQGLKSRGLVSIKHSRQDARRRDVSLTAKGKTVQQKAHKVLAAQAAGVWRALNRGETAALESAVNKLTA